MLKSKISVTCTSCFNQTTHARPKHTIVFIHNISLYFNCISSVKYVFKWSCYGHIMPLQYDPNTNPKNSIRLVWKMGKVLMHISECQFFALFIVYSKMATFDEGFEVDSKRLYS